MKAFPRVSAAFLLAALPLAAEVPGRWAVGGALGAADFLSPESVREATDPSLYAGVFARRGMSERGELLAAFETVEARGDAESARLRPVTLSWLQAFGSGAWSPYGSLGAGPAWTRGANSDYSDRLQLAARAGLGFERSVGDDLGLGIGLQYHYVFPDGRYARESSTLSLGVSLSRFFRCGTRPAPKAAPRAMAAPPPPDADGDGVPDARDVCPETPPEAAVDALGCPLDTDADGVADHMDRCADTPRGVLVDEGGCPAESVSVTLDVKFELGRAEVKPEFEGQLQRVAEFMKRFPETTVLIEGHSDNTGNPAKNLSLSQRRADAVRDALVNTLGADGNRVSAKGFGSSRPVADNASPEGRAANRRVVATIQSTKK